MDVTFEYCDNGVIHVAKEIEELTEIDGKMVFLSDMHLIRDSDYIEWKKQWNGTYELHSEGDFQDGVDWLYDYPHIYIDIDIDNGHIVFAFYNDEESELNQDISRCYPMLLFDGNALIFNMSEFYFQEFNCSFYSLGKDAFRFEYPIQNGVPNLGSFICYKTSH